MTDTELQRRKAICEVAGVDDIGNLSDGFHTFNSLYEQRMILFAALVKAYKEKAWKSYRHEDGEYCFGGGWFIVGIDTPEGSYTYHYENKYWDMFDCVDLLRAKHWDGHTEDDAETRLMSLDPVTESAQPETEERTKKSAQNVPNDDLISRKMAIEELRVEFKRIPTTVIRAIERLNGLPSAQPDLDQWCTDCKEYDKEKHHCPRYNRVIRKALKDSELEPCEDTVSREDAIRWVKTECNPYGKPTLDFESGKKVIGYLKRMSPVTPKRKKGKWVPHIEKSREYIGTVLVNIRYDYWFCDTCSYRVEIGQPLYNFCPNCGADMRG